MISGIEDRNDKYAVNSNLIQMMNHNILKATPNVVRTVAKQSSVPSPALLKKKLKFYIFRTATLAMKVTQERG